MMSHVPLAVVGVVRRDGIRTVTSALRRRPRRRRQWAPRLTLPRRESPWTS